MKTIKILGVWCPNCQKLENNMKIAVEKIWLNVNIEKITDIDKMMTYDIVSLPWIVIGERLVSSWRVLEVEEIINLINDNCCGSEGCCKNWDHLDQEDVECCEDNTWIEEVVEIKSKGGCCCGGGNC